MVRFLVFLAGLCCLVLIQPEMIFGWRDVYWYLKYNNFTLKNFRDAFVKYIIKGE